MTSPTRLLDHMAGDLATLPTPTDQVGNPTATLDSNSSAPKHRFYVYCKHPCGKMSPGKLRVRCADCKDAAFVLDGVRLSVCLSDCTKPRISLNLDNVVNVQ